MRNKLYYLAFFLLFLAVLVFGPEWLFRIITALGVTLLFLIVGVVTVLTLGATAPDRPRAGKDVNQ